MSSKIALVLLLFSTTIFAAPLPLQDISGILFPASIVFTAIMLGLAYMLSGMLENPQLAGWVKIEVKEVIASGIIVLLAFILITGSKPFVGVFTGHGDYVVAINERVDKYMSNMQGSFDDLIKANHYLTLMAGYYYSTGPNFFYFSYSYTASPLNGVGPVLYSLSQASGGLSNGMLALKVIGTLVVFFSSIATTLMFGVFALCIFPFTRRIGVTLIALLIGASVIFPIATLIVFDLQDNAFTPNADSPANILAPRISNWDGIEFSLPWGLSILCSKEFEVMKGLVSLTEVVWGIVTCIPFIPYGFYACYQAVTAAWFPAAQMVVSNTLSVALLSFGDTLTDFNASDILGVLRPFLEGINNLMVLIYVDMILIAIITIVATKSVSQALGGEFYLSTLERLV
ncbi:MAG: hypothetical protein ABII22_03205 [Candidatus Micrarchaeota archaeon]